MSNLNTNNSDIDIVRAWKDEEYRNSLSEEQLKQLPENPAGMIELSDENMETIAGGYPLEHINTGTGSTNPPCRCTCYS